MKPQPPTSPSATAASADTTRAGEVSRRSFVGNSIKGVTALTVAAPLAAQAADADQREPTAHDTAVAVPSAGTQTVDRSFATELVPGDCDYRVALPPGYSADRDHAYPLLLLLHGGGGSRDFLNTLLPALDELWRRAITDATPEQPALAGDDQLEPCVAVCASAGRSFYMDHRDGSAAWETLLVTELLDAVRAEFNVAAESGRTAVCGVSMGGMGCLRLAFKHPDLFGTVAALEPAIESSLRYDTLKPADTFYRADQYVEKFGVDGAVDRDYWARNNPATIAATGPDRLRDLAILIEAGTEDGFELHHGAEFLHRVLWDRGLKHEYRLVLGADHVGRSLEERFPYALGFIGRQWNPGPADQAAVAFREQIAPLRRLAGLD